MNDQLPSGQHAEGRRLAMAPDLNISVPIDSSTHIASFFGCHDKAAASWLSLSLVHPSAAPRSPSPSLRASCSSLLAFLRDLGRRYLNLGSYHVANEIYSFENLADAATYADSLVAAYIDGLWTKLSLNRRVLFGPGEQMSRDHASEGIREGLVCQIIGALSIIGDYGRILTSLRTTRNEGFSLEQSLTIDYKSFLLEELQKRRWSAATYAVVREEGPEHSKIFTIRVTSGARSELGSGRSKKAAGQEAARAFIAAYMPHLMDYYARPRGLRGNVRRASTNTRVVHKEHRAQVAELVTRLRLTAATGPLLSQALTHESYRLKDAIHYACESSGRLAQFGAFALDALLWDVLGEKLLIRPQAVSVTSVRGLVAHALRAESCAKLFDRLDLNRAVLLGTGQAVAGMTPKMKADFAQAIIGAALLGAPHPGDLRHLLAWTFDWIRSEETDYLSDPTAHHDAKSRLQEYGALLAFNTEYTHTESGPAHNRSYTSSVLATSQHCDHPVVLGSGTGISHKAADQQAALQALEKIRTVNTARLVNVTSLSEAHRFLLLAVFSHVPKTFELSRRWAEAGLLAAHSLLDGEVLTFIKWADYIEEHFLGASLTTLNLSNVLQYYGFVRTLIGHDLQELYEKCIEELDSVVRGLDPTADCPNLRGDPRFVRLIELSRLSSLLAKPFTEVIVEQVLEGFKLLCQKKHPSISITNCDKDVTMVEREGELHSVLDGLVELLVPMSAPAEISCMFDREERVLTIRLRCDGSVDITKMMEVLGGSVFWKFIEADLPVVHRTVSIEGIEIKLYLIEPAAVEGFATLAIRSFHAAPFVYSTEEHSIVARLVHDLKNQLIAFQQCLASVGLGRTADLRLRLEASQHVDAAESLLAALETVGHAFQEPAIEPIDLAEFFQGYVSAKIPALGSSIRLDPPRTREHVIVYSSTDFLRSILDNLINNSAEAMPSGGNISLDWVFDRGSETLLVEVSDDGPGMPQDLLEKVVRGESVRSRKAKGSGIGMMTVRSMLDRIDGRLGGDSCPSTGTRWSIAIKSLPPAVSLPSLEEIDAEVSEP
jgi:dsRNA-specific ribonuclease